MAVYAYSSVTATNGAHILTASDGESPLTSMLFYGEDLNVGPHGAAVHWTSSATATSTAEKLNTRSPAPVSTYLADSSPGNVRIDLRIAAFSHGSWRAHPLRPLLAAESEGHHVDPSPNFAAGSTGLKLGFFAEPRQPATGRNIRGRCSRNGTLFILGNNIGHHQKTGGGAFSMRAPHFDNDVAWIDPSPWRNGMAQSDVWSMQMFGTPPAPATFNPAWAMGSTRVIGGAF